ncbi:MAG: hypothetical protein HYR63_29205 [Proteobacteria bacterium]|nr:hypothetical protein [Pseudomonadota bacterium]
MLQAAIAGAEVVRRASPQHGAEIAIKGHGDYQTPIDRASEAAIAAELTRSFPNCRIHGEEHVADVQGDGDTRFLIDPIDGTTNFIWGVPFFSVAIALEEGTAFTAGVVLDPLRAEVFVADRGHGSFFQRRAACHGSA